MIPTACPHFKIKDIQRERAIEIASKDEEIAHLRSQLESEHKVPSSEDQTLQAEFEALQKLYVLRFLFRCKRLEISLHLPQVFYHVSCRYQVQFDA